MINFELRQAYKKLNWEGFLRQQLGEAGSLELARPWLERTKKFLDKLLNHKVMDVLPQLALSEVESSLRNFISFMQNDILQYSDVTQRDLKIENIKNETGNLLTNLSKYSIYFDELPVSADDRAVTEAIELITTEREADVKELKEIKEGLGSDKVKEALEFANALLNNREKIDNAIAKVEEFDSTNEKAVEKLLRRNANSFAQKAQEHIAFAAEYLPISWFGKNNYLSKIKRPSWSGKYYWLWLGIFFGLVVLALLGYFIFDRSYEHNWENTVLRLSILSVPVYFAIFSVNQFLSHRRLYEIYKFKDVALQTMIMLKPQFADDPEGRRELLRRSMQVIFAEPTIKEENKYDKQLITEIVRMLNERH